MRKKMISVILLFFAIILLISGIQNKKSFANDINNSKNVTAPGFSSQTKPETADIMYIGIGESELSVFYDSITEMANDSEAVIYGEITDYSFNVDNTLIYTILQIKVIESLCGDLTPGEEINLFRLGGYIRICDFIQSYESSEDRNIARNGPMFKDLTDEDINSKFICSMPEGYFSPDKGDRAIYFLINKTGMKETYDIAGTWQGEYHELTDGTFRKASAANEVSSQQEIDAIPVCTYEELKEQIIDAAVKAQEN